MTSLATDMQRFPNKELEIAASSGCEVQRTMIMSKRIGLDKGRGKESL